MTLIYIKWPLNVTMTSLKDIPVAMRHNATIEKIIAKDNRRQFGLTIKKANEGAELTR